MLGLGLSLSIEDFKRIIIFPKAMIIGLLCQMVVLPLLCFVLSVAFNLSSELSVGMMLLAACPGGATANLYSYLAKGDLALNISLTAINAALSLLTLPLIVSLSMLFFLGERGAIPVQTTKIIEVFSVILIPVTIGMFVKNKFSVFAEKVENTVKVLSVVFLVLITVGALTKEGGKAVDYIIMVLAPVIILNAVGMELGYVIPKLFKINRKQCVSISMEVGIQNAILAIYIATSVLGNINMAIPAGVYGITAFVGAAIFAFRLKQGHFYLKPF